MNKNYKIVEVFKHQELANKLLWKGDELSQLIVVSLEDEEDMYYAEDFISIMHSAHSEGMSSAKLILG